MINNDNCQWNSRGHHWSIKNLVVYNNRYVWKIWLSIYLIRVACHSEWLVPFSVADPQSRYGAPTSADTNLATFFENPMNLKHIWSVKGENLSKKVWNIHENKEHLVRKVGWGVGLVVEGWWIFNEDPSLNFRHIIWGLLCLPLQMFPAMWPQRNIHPMNTCSSILSLIKFTASSFDISLSA